MATLLFKSLLSLNTSTEATKFFSRNPLKLSSLDTSKTVRKASYLKCEHQYDFSSSSSKHSLSRKADSKGIGINEFFEGKSLLVTGATGFLAKALIEKILRATPKINKIYLLIRAKDKEAAFGRLTSEIIESKLFRCVKEKHGELYEHFIESKLIPVVGNIHEPNLGMDLTTFYQIAEEIDLIIDSAAITAFDERYDLALDANVNGPFQLMMFAKKCKNLKLVMHFSTAYANGEREGLLFEKPFTMGESITKERITSISPTTKFPSLHASTEIDFVSQLKNVIPDNICLDEMMKGIGSERAKFYGWQNTYSFTKAIGEMMLDSMRDEIPLVIVRPSVITSCYNEPFSGWIQGFRVVDPLIFFYGKGDLPSLLGDPDCLVDCVPVDMVVNTTMAAIAKHGHLQSPGVNVYHVTSTSVNPFSLSQLFDYSNEFFNSFPFANSKGDKVEVMKIKFFDKISDFSKYILEDLSRQHGVGGSSTDEKQQLKIQKRFKRKMEYLNHFSKLYEPYTFYKGWFDNSNVRKLMKDMSEEEELNFEIDVTKINWKDYFIGIHIPGVQEHALKGRKLPS